MVVGPSYHSYQTVLGCGDALISVLLEVHIILRLLKRKLLPLGMVKLAFC
jgi:hypothetical protein